MNHHQPFFKKRRSKKPTLSPRERDCLALLFEGNTLKQIAGELGIKQSTVKTYFQRLKEKLGARNLRELIIEAFTQNIV